MNEASHKVHLLERFHITVIIVNAIAVCIDLYLGRHVNAAIEASMAVLLGYSLWHLKQKRSVPLSSYTFLGITAAGLLALISLNHFATMSVVFILLLPLTTLLFVRLRQTLLLAGVMLGLLALMLYAEYHINPGNPIAHNPRALFNLGYAAAIIYLFGILYHLSIVRTFDELDDANRQKAMLLSEVHHRVKNNLNVIASIVGMQANRLRGESHDALLSTKSRIESISIVHQMLYQHDDFEHIDVKAYLEKLTTLLRGMYGSGNFRIVIESGVAKLPLSMMIQLGMIVNELFTNSIKYAFAEQPGQVTITLFAEGKEARFVYRDDGKGVEDVDVLEQGTSLGVKLVKLAVRQLKGSVEIENDHGLKYTVRFVYG